MGSLDKGKAFKTELAITQIQDVLSLEITDKDDIASLDKSQVVEILERSGLVRDPKKLVEDGWRKDFTYAVDENTGKITVTSDKLNAFNDKHNPDSEQ